MLNKTKSQLTFLQSLFRFSAAAAVVSLTACVSQETQMAYYQTEQLVRLAESEALVAKYKAMSEISHTGNDTVKAVALMSLSRKDGPEMYASNIKAPENPSDVAFKWLSILAPVGLEAFRTVKSSQVQMHSSDNNVKSLMFSTQSSENTNLGLARLINPTPVIAPQPVVVQQPAPIIVRPDVVNPVVVQTR